MGYGKLAAAILVSAIVFISSDLFAQEKIAKDVMQLHLLLPETILGWSAKSAGEIFTRDTIFDYMDGAGEIYLAYDFDHLFVREYGKESAPSIVAEIYQMSSSEDAYGIFTHDTDGEPIPLGEEAMYAAGLLWFWKGTTFVRLFAERETDEVKSVLMRMGNMIADAIPQQSQKPRLVACLPDEGLIAQSVHYFHKLISLDVHYYLADSNILNLNEQTEVILARYQGKKYKARLLLIGYPGTDEVKTAYSQFVQAYFPDKPATHLDMQVEQVENGEFVSARRTDRFLILVFEASNQATCERLTKATEDKLEATFK
jgi:hypothetical protein